MKFQRLILTTAIAQLCAPVLADNAQENEVIARSPAASSQVSDQNTTHAENADHGKRSDDSWLYEPQLPQQRERILPSQTFTVWGGKVASGAGDAAQQTADVKRAEKDFSINSAQFASGKASVTSTTGDQISQVLEGFRDKQNIRFEFIGHTDSQRLSAQSKAIYSDNYGLGLSRAKQVGTFVLEALDLPEGAATYSSLADTIPLSKNDTAEGMALNRRVEIKVWYDEVVAEPKPCQSTHTQLAERPAFSVSVDGQSRIGDVPPNNADAQRCQDVALAANNIQLKYDNLSQPARLSISASERTAVAGEAITFQGYSNYGHWIDRAEVEVLTRQGDVVKTLALDKQFSGQWIPEEGLPSDLVFFLRAFDKKGRYDETELRPLRLVNEPSPRAVDQSAGSIESLNDGDSENELSAAQQRLAELSASYGENHLRRHRIPVEGGVVTVNGHSIAPTQQVRVMGAPVLVDGQGRFVVQQIVPRGQYQVDISVLEESGEGKTYQREILLPKDDWFTVALADITAGKNSTSDHAQAVNGGDKHYSDSSYVDGRLAFYTKGKIDNRYTVTASADTGEQEIQHLFSNIDDKNTREQLRRMDATRHWPTFGDDSTLVEDAPTQGKFYARVEEGHSFATWGNFDTEQTDTELTQLDRALYGAKVHYADDEYTASGEHKLVVDAFAAEPGTLSAREDLRGTGGSVFFLRHQDITRGSERVRVEVRDKDSGLVLNVNNLLAGQDYDVDSVQGRILLSSPLSSVADENTLVRASNLDGHPNYLVVNYEYTPGFTEVTDLSMSGRVAYWVNDGVKVGLTQSRQKETGEIQDLSGLDVTLRKTANTWVKVEVAQTQGRGLAQHVSDDGGYGFTESDRGGDEADAHRIEGAFKLDEVFGEVPSHTSERSDGIEGTFYIENRDKGFSAPGRLTSGDTEKFGGSLTAPLSESTDLSVKYDETTIANGNDLSALSIDLVQEIAERWTLSAGLRADERDGDTVDTGDRQDLAVELGYNADEDWRAWGFAQGTLQKSGDRGSNSRVGLGGQRKLGERLTGRGEVSGGDTGLGLMAGFDYQWTDRTNVYLNYQLDNDRTDNGVRSRSGQLVSGVRSRWSDSVSVYAEGRHQAGANGSGLMQAYGLDYSPTDEWSYGASVEHGDINSETDNQIERLAITASVGYSGDGHRYGGALEYRNDESHTEERRSWLWRNNYSAQLSDDWRTIAQLDLAFSDSDLGSEYSGEFVEGSLGYAYRPVNNDKLNALVKYTYLYDLAPPQQLNPGDVNTVEYAQRSNVFAADITYDLTSRWTVGAKYAYRFGELRPSRDSSAEWFESEGQLLVLRADWHVIHKWDITTEWRRREEKDAQDSRDGALLAVYRHFGQNAKLGVGYNFANFSDDLTDLDYDADGVFVNLIGKF